MSENVISIEKQLSSVYYQHINKIHELRHKNKQEGFEYMINNYLEQYDSFFKIYNKSKDLREVYVYRDEDFNLCRIVLCAETDKNLVKYAVKQLKQNEEPIMFTKNYVVIQKQITAFNFSIIQGIVDYGDISSAIIKAELNNYHTKA